MTRKSRVIEGLEQAVAHARGDKSAGTSYTVWVPNRKWLRSVRKSVSQLLKERKSKKVRPVSPAKAAAVAAIPRRGTRNKRRERAAKE